MVNTHMLCQLNKVVPSSLVEFFRLQRGPKSQTILLKIFVQLHSTNYHKLKVLVNTARSIPKFRRWKFIWIFIQILQTLWNDSERATFIINTVVTKKTGLCQIVYVISPHTRMFHGTKVAAGKTKTSPISEVITLQENLAYVPIENMFLA